MCIVAERISSAEVRIPIHTGPVERYWFVSEYDSGKRFDKQAVGATRQPEFVTYGGATIGKHIGLSIPFSMLIE